MTRIVPGYGPRPARVMLVGEAPGAEEEARGRPFVGASGYELDRMLGEAGIAREECYVTNCCRERPPNNDITHFISSKRHAPTPAHVLCGGKWVLEPIVEGIARLRADLLAVQPNVVIALGGTALWALTGREGITKWRGSLLYCSQAGLERTRVVPTLHPAAVLRQWSERATTVQDLKRAALYRDGRPYPDPQWRFALRPSYEQTLSILGALLVRVGAGEQLRLAFDLETRAGHIACAGIAWSRTDAICIPFMQTGAPDGYFSADEEASVLWMLRRLLTDQRVDVVGQNLLYDCQYTYRHWGWVPHVTMDVMVGWHSAFSDRPKRLDYIASLLCDYYVQWKGSDLYQP